MDLTDKVKMSSTTDEFTLTENPGTSRKIKKFSWPWSSTLTNGEDPKKNRKISWPLSSKLMGIEQNSRENRTFSCYGTRADYSKKNKKCSWERSSKLTEKEKSGKNKTLHWPLCTKFTDSEDFIRRSATCLCWKKTLTRSKSTYQKNKEGSPIVPDFCNEVLARRNNPMFQETDIVLYSVDNPNPANLVRRTSAPKIPVHSVIRCNMCTHLNESVALFVADCGVNVHENSCKDQIAQCSKFPHTKVSAILICFLNRK